MSYLWDRQWCIEHGVGRFLGLEILTIDEEEDEFLSIGYAEGAKLYVPMSLLHLLVDILAQKSPLPFAPTRLGTMESSKKEAH